MKRIMLAAAVGLWAAEVCAQSAYRVATDLGQVIGSEEACGLAFDQAAIEAYIAANVPADAMDFTVTLNAEANVLRRRIVDWPKSRVTAHCAQIARVAKTYGFVK